MPSTDEWGGVEVGDDWGGVAVAEKDDWGGVAVDAPSVPPLDETWTPERIDAHNREAERVRGLEPGSLDKPVEDPDAAGIAALRSISSPATLSELGTYTGNDPLKQIGETPLMTADEARTDIFSKSPIEGMLPRPSGDSITALIPEDKNIMRSVAGVVGGASELVEGLPTGMNLFLMGSLPGAPKPLQQAASAYFASTMGKHGLESAVEALHTSDPKEAARLGTSAVGELLMGGFAFSHLGSRFTRGGQLTAGDLQKAGLPDTPESVDSLNALKSRLSTDTINALQYGPDTEKTALDLEAAGAAAAAEALRKQPATIGKLTQILKRWQVEKDPAEKSRLWDEMQALTPKEETPAAARGDAAYLDNEGNLVLPSVEGQARLDAKAKADAEAEKAAEAPPASVRAQPTSLPDAPAPVNEVLTGEEFKSDSERYRTELDEYQRQLAAWTAEQPEGKPIVFTRGDTTRAVTKSPPDPSRDVQGRPWRVTTFDKDGEPIGHTLHDTREEAVMTAKGTTGNLPETKELISTPPTESGGGNKPAVITALPTVETVLQDALQEHGDLGGAGEAIQRTIEDPATTPEHRAVLETALKRLNTIAEAESRRSEAGEAADTRATEGEELLDLVKEFGGLPAQSSKHFAAHTGELGDLMDALKMRGKGANQNQEILGPHSEFFSKDAPSVDDLRAQLNQAGFEFETPYDVIEAVKQRFQSGEKRFAEKDTSGLPIGPGKMTVGELPPQRTTGLKKATVKDERIQRGLDDLPPAERQGEEARVQAAEDRVDTDPTAGPSLVARIVDEGQHAISPDEAAVLLVERTRLSNERQVWQERAGEGEAGTEAPLARIEQQMERLDQAQRASGSSWGRVGRLYQRMMRADFTLEPMLSRERASRGEALTQDQVAAVQKEADAIAADQAAFDAAQNAEDLAREAAEVQATHQAESQAEFGGTPGPKWSKRVFEAAQKIVDSLEARGDAARARLRGKLGRASAGVDPTIVLDVAEIMAAKIAKFGLEKAEASASMLAEFGEEIRPYLDKAWEKAKKIFEKATPTTGTRDAVKRTAKAKVEKTPADALATAKAQAVAGDNLNHATVFAYVRALLKDGVKEADVMKAAYTGLKEHFEDLTQRDVNRAYVEYGKRINPSKEALKVTERHLRRVVKLEEDIARLEKDKLDPLRQGYQRDKADIQIRDLMRQRNDLLKESTTPPSPEKLASIDEGKQTRLKNAIEEMDRQIATEEKVPRAPGAADSPAVVKMKAELKAMRDLWQEIDARKNPPPTPEQAQLDALAKVRHRLDDKLSSGAAPAKRGDFTALSEAANDMQAEIIAMRELVLQLRRDAKPGVDVSAKKEAATIKALEAAIERYRDKVARGDFSTKGKAHGPDTAKVAALREVLASRKSMYEAAEKAGKPVRTAEERYNDTRLKGIERQLKALEARMKAGDFGPRVKSVKPALSAATEKAKATLDARKLEFVRKQAEFEKERWNNYRKTYDVMKEVGALPRAIMSSFDVSAVGRQGGFVSMGNPGKMKVALGEMAASIKSEADFQQRQAAISLRDNAENGYYDKMKLFIADRADTPLSIREEILNSRWSEKIPVAGKGIRISNRAYVGFLNRLRVDTADALVAAIGKGRELSKAELELIGNFVNVATGRGDLGAMAQYSEGLAGIFFSPRLWASRWQMLTMQPIRRGLPTAILKGEPLNLRARAFIAREYAKSLTGVAVVLGLGAIAGASVEKDPRSTDFLKLRWGKTRVDMTSGISQAAVDLTRVLTSKIKRANGVVAKQDRARTMASRVRNKLAPIPGAAWDTFDIAQDVKTPPGHPTTLGGVAGGLVLPIGLQPMEVVRLMQAQGVPRGVALKMLDLAGFSTQTYDDTPAKKR